VAVSPVFVSSSEVTKYTSPPRPPVVNVPPPSAPGNAGISDWALAEKARMDRKIEINKIDLRIVFLFWALARFPVQNYYFA